MLQHKETIELAWENRELLKSEETRIAIREIIEAIDKGRLRVAEPMENGDWQVNDWVKRVTQMTLKHQLP